MAEQKAVLHCGRNVVQNIRFRASERLMHLSHSFLAGAVHNLVLGRKWLRRGAV
jgi:hypothetical protein